jgi:hypothetical protein
MEKYLQIPKIPATNQTQNRMNSSNELPENARKNENNS